MIHNIVPRWVKWIAKCILYHCPQTGFGGPKDALNWVRFVAWETDRELVSLANLHWQIEINLPLISGPMHRVSLRMQTSLMSSVKHKALCPDWPQTGFCRHVVTSGAQALLCSNSVPLNTLNKKHIVIKLIPLWNNTSQQAACLHFLAVKRDNLTFTGTRWWRFSAGDYRFILYSVCHRLNPCDAESSCTHLAPPASSPHCSRSHAGCVKIAEWPQLKGSRSSITDELTSHKILSLFLR